MYNKKYFNILPFSFLFPHFFTFIANIVYPRWLPFNIVLLFVLIRYQKYIKIVNVGVVSVSKVPQ